MDASKESQLLAWLAEIEAEEEANNVVLQDEDENSEVSDNDGNYTEQCMEVEIPDESNAIDVISSDSTLFYLGKDGKTKWGIHPQRGTSRTRKHNLVTHLPGVKRTAKNRNTPSDCWSLFFPNETIVEIVQHTNTYLDKMRHNYSRERDVGATNIEEVRALFGLLYLAGISKASHVNLEDLWATDGTAPECYRTVMSKSRFYTLLRALRFDNIHDRVERQKSDKLAPIRKVFSEFVERCTSSYQVGEYCCIDEMLEGFRGKCSFRQYIPSKPAKYGIKIFALVDSRTFYTSKMEIYAGKQPEGDYQLDNSPSSVVKRLIDPIAHTGRNLTCDNWFTSIPLAVDLLHNYKTTLVGTLRKNKAEIPPLFITPKGRKLKSSIFGYGKDCLLLSYVPKKNKNVLMLSTFHETDAIDKASGDECKSEVITFYNLTKGAVDVVDQMKSTYSVSRISCRWPLTIFFSLMNIAGINSQIIFYSNTNTRMDRRLYLKALSTELMKPHLVNRASIRTLPVLLRLQIRRVAGLPAEEPGAEVAGPSERIKCSFCPRSKNRKTTTRCIDCSKAICGEHTITQCQACRSGNEDYNN